jgi:hypothetical protein
MATESKETKEAKIVDVSQPGKTAPAGTSRPIIVGHKMLQQDPMISEDKAATVPEPGKTEDKPAEAAPAAAPRNNKVIAPLTESKSEDEPPEPEAKTEEPKPEEPKPEETKEEGSEPAKADGSAVVDAVIEQAGAKRKQDQESEADKKRQAELEKLIEEKKYFVPIGQVRRRRNTRWGITILLLLVIIAGAYLALDAGLIQANIKLPVDLIKN